MAKSLCISLIVCYFYSCVTGLYNPPAVEQGSICRDIDIRNKVESFYQLENCSVIEGSLSILLIEGATQEQYQTLSFPNLVEITDYLLLYRVYGLKTLSNIFPNLSVIRGQRLFYNFAFVVFEMMDLEELGLIGLTVIERGAIRLEKNSMLCYIDTIDWTRISSVDPKDHFIKGNKNSSECIDICPAKCTPTQKSDYESHKMIPRCWTMQHCQRNLDCPCTNNPPGFCINNTKTCCHDNCLGGCSGVSNSDCDSCRDVIFTDKNDESRCTKTCLPGTYMYKNRRCLLDKECVAYRQKLLKDPALGPDSPGQCVPACPAGFTESNTDPNKCIKCKDTCPKGCTGKKVDSVQAAQDLSGCTKIEGALEIRIIKGSNIQQELEENLGQITEIRDYLWIHNSHALLSLNFLKSLTKIGGNGGPNGYALLINDNENLQTLFIDDVEKNLEIRHGNMSFHFNRKLCLHLIRKFEKNVKMAPNAQNDIGNTTNGDQAACSVSTLNLTVFQVTGHVAFLKWDRYELGDKRAIISYVIKYKEAPFQNVSMFEGRDACSDDIWKTRDMLNTPNKNSSCITSLLVQLRPWTQYAVFVKTYTTSNTQFGARSKLIYFRTAPSVPTVPSDLKARAMTPGELHVTWNPPNQPNGNVTHYEVYWRRRELDPRSYAPRDYCNNPLMAYGSKHREEEDRQREEEKRRKENESNGQCCKCEESVEDLAKKARERNMQIEFENFLHNSVYLKRDPFR